MPSDYHFKLEVRRIGFQLLIDFLPHLELLQQGYLHLVIVVQTASDVTHLYNIHILLYAFLQSNLNTFAKEWLVFDEIVHEGELVLEVVPN